MLIQDACPEHIPGIYRLRLAVRENVLTEEMIRQHQLAPEDVVDAFRKTRKGWVVVEDGQVVGVSIADSFARSIWGLFVLPGYEGRGIGRALLEVAVNWLWEQGAERIWLTTTPETRAAGFYQHLGWEWIKLTEKGEVRFELARRESNRKGG